MKTLLILRHAKSSWSNSRLADHDRPLNDRGRRDAPRMGRLLRDEGVVPELIISSSAERALTTAEQVALSSGYEEEIEVTRELYHAAAEDYIAQLRKRGREQSTIMVVGHNPGLEELVELLTDEDEVLSTAALARVALPIRTWQELDEATQGTLVDLWRPKDLA